MSWNTVKQAIAANVPVVLWGPPGVGKTARLGQLAKELGWPMETVILSIREPSDLGGLPVVRPDGVVLEAPAWARRLATTNGPAILFLDELSTAPPATQAAALRVILDRVVGDRALGPEVRIIAAANPPEMAAGGWYLSPPMANRFVHVDISADLDDWISWALNPQEGDRPGELEARAHVAGFLKVRPPLLSALPKEEASRGGAWPSPRSWAMAARLVAGVPLGSSDYIQFLSQTVGEGAALEAVEWLRAADLPDPEVLLKKPEAWQVPLRNDRTYATLLSVIGAVGAKITHARLESLCKLAAAVVNAGQPDIAAGVAKRIGQLFVASDKSKEGRYIPTEASMLAALGPILRVAVGSVS